MSNASCESAYGLHTRCLLKLHLESLLFSDVYDESPQANGRCLSHDGRRVQQHRKSAAVASLCGILVYTHTVTVQHLLGIGHGPFPVRRIDHIKGIKAFFKIFRLVFKLFESASVDKGEIAVQIGFKDGFRK